MVDLRRPDYDRPRMLRHVDLALPLLTVMVALIGVVMVYSATRGPATEIRPAETFHLVRQARLAGLGVLAMVAAGWFGHRRLHRFVPLVYLGMLGLFGAVLLVGTEVKGAVAVKFHNEDGEREFAPPRLVVTGKLDRLCVGDEAVLVVDYKTTRRPPQSLDQVPAATLKQMSAYAHALATIYPGRRISAALLYTHAPQLIALPEDLLAQHKPGLGDKQLSLPGSAFA